MCNIELFFKTCVSVYLWVCERERERETRECVCKCVVVPGSCPCIRCEGQSAISAVVLHLSACLRWVSLGWLTLELLSLSPTS